MKDFRSTDWIGKDVIVTYPVGGEVLLTNVRQTCDKNVVGTKTTDAYIGHVRIGYSDLPGVPAGSFTAIREA